MKKLLTIAAIAGVASLSHGQGYIGVANSTTTKISTGGAPTPSWTNEQFYFEVLIAPTTVTTISTNNPLSGGWLDSTIMMTNTTPGRVAPANNNVDNLGAQVPSGFSTTGTANFAVIGWSADLGPTLADALAEWNGGTWWGGPGSGLPPYDACFGISSVALDVFGAPAGGPYWSIWGTVANGQIPGMNLWLPEIPEPSTFALCGLGAAITLILRRPKLQTNPMAQGAW